MYQSKEINSINLHITNKCNMNCPYCCCQIPQKKERIDYDKDYFGPLEKYFKNLTIIITGGEPTTHSNFIDIIFFIKEKIKPINFKLATNGYGFKIYPVNHFEIFDEIYITEYNEPSNKEKIEYITEKIDKNKTLLTIWKNVKHLKTPMGNKPCHRGHNGISSYNEGLLFPCCVSSFKREIGIKLSDNWKNEILKVKLPCGDCVFGEK